MWRDEKITATLPDPLREAVGLPLGNDGAYFVGGADLAFRGQDDSSVVGYNDPPGGPRYGYVNAEGSVVAYGDRDGSEEFKDLERPSWSQPGLWCQWIPVDSKTIQWDEGEKFYEYIEWLAYLIEHFLGPWNVTFSGDVHWEGEESDDFGRIELVQNVMFISEGVRTFGNRVQVN